MHRLPITILIVFTIFSQNALGSPVGVVDNFLRLFRTITTRKPTDVEILETLVKIEERLGFFNLDHFLSAEDIEALAKSRFNPFKSKVIREARDQDTFRTAIFEYIRDNHLDSPIVLRWWDASHAFRNMVFSRLGKDHLSNSEGGSKLLLKWWKEARSRGIEDQLEVFIEQAFRTEDPGSDPFMITAFKAARDNGKFADHIEQILENPIPWNE